MKRAVILILILGLVSVTARAQKGYTYSAAEANFVMKSSAALSDTLIQVDNTYSFHPKWANITPGLEFNISKAELSRYYLEDRLQFTDRSAVVVRLNHYQVNDWEIGQNYLNAYFAQELNRLDWALGLTYTTVNLHSWADPVKFTPETQQVRLIYSVGYMFPFHKNKFDFKFGAENFTNFENYGYDQLGPFFELGWKPLNGLRVKVRADIRIAGIESGLIGIERETFLVGLEWKNVPKPAKKTQP